MERSPIKGTKIKRLLESALTDKINSYEVYMKGITQGYYYEGYVTFNENGCSNVLHEHLPPYPWSKKAFEQLIHGITEPVPFS